MSGKAFFDTNILVYVVGQNDERTDTVEALLELYMKALSLRVILEVDRREKVPH